MTSCLITNELVEDVRLEALKMPVTMSLGDVKNGGYAKVNSTKESNFGELAKVLSHFRESKLTEVEYNAATDAAQKGDKAGAWVSLAHYDGLHRVRKNWNGTNCVVLDADATNGKEGADKLAGKEYSFSLEQLKERFKGCRYIIAPTHSYTDEIPRWRVFIFLTKVINDADIFEQVARHLAMRLNGYVDPRSYLPEQLWYLPSCPKGEIEKRKSLSSRSIGKLFDWSELTSSELPLATTQLVMSVKLGNDLTAELNLNKEPYPFTPENALEFLSAARTAYPMGIPDRQSFFELGMACAELVVVHDWPEREVRKIFDEICSEPKGANTDDNDTEWENYLSGTSGKVKQGERVLSHRSVFAKAHENGWQPKAKATDALTAVQNKFALISLGGKIGVVDKQDLEVTSADGTASRLVVMSRMDGGLLVQRYLSSEFSQVDSKSTLGTFTHSKNTTLYNGVEFNPRNTTANTLNLWVGATITPKQGKCTLIHTLLLEVLCGGRQSEYQYLIKYLAHALQRPWEKPGVMIILLGGQGVGKGTLAKILQKIWSATFLQTNRIKQIVGDFNGSLERAYIVFLDEALFVGDRNSSDALKSLVTEPTISINEKHQPTRQIKSYHRFFSATNADHFKATDRDDRRDFVLRVSEHRKSDHTFWDALNAEIEHGGVEAFTHELLAIDLTGFNVRAKPNTKELTEQKLQSLDKFPRWWFDCLSQGEIFSRSDNEWPSFISSATLLSQFTEADKAVRSYKQIIDRDIVSFMSKVCPSAKREQGMEGSHRRRGYALPTLEAARVDFEKFIGDKIEWENL